MYADMQKCHKAAHKNIKTGSGILTVDEAKILLKSHPEYILPQDSRMIHLLQNHKLWEFRDAEQTLESVLRILRRAVVQKYFWGISSLHGTALKIAV